MHIVVRTAALVLSATAATACARGTRPGELFPVSSVGSDYSPVVRMGVRIDERGDSIIVSTGAAGEMIAPGEVPGRRRALMRRIYMEALVVRSGPTGKEKRREGEAVVMPTPWLPLAASPPVLVADSLVLGVPHPIPPVRFALPRPDTLDARRDWLVFRVRADGEATPIQLADGSTLPQRTMADGVRVFACADRSLSGRIDKKRKKRLSTEYLAACQPSEAPRIRLRDRTLGFDQAIERGAEGELRGDDTRLAAMAQAHDVEEGGVLTRHDVAERGVPVVTRHGLQEVDAFLVRSLHAREASSSAIHPVGRWRAATVQLPRAAR